jgi:acylphosphatase
MSGWARNRADGALEVVLEGDPRAVATITAFCEEGPPRALVSSVEMVAEEPEGLNGFEIR